MSKKLTLDEIANAAPVSAIDALRRNLLYAMLKGTSESDMVAIVQKQVDKAREGDSKAAKLVIDMIRPTHEDSQRERMIREEGGIADYKLEIRKLIACLIAFQGPQTTEDVCSRLHLTGQVGVDALTCNWFNREGGKWFLTNEARTKVLDASQRVLLKAEALTAE